MERENKFLRSQKAVLERDISKRDSVVGKRCDSAVERSSNVFEPKRGRSPAIAVDQVILKSQLILDKKLSEVSYVRNMFKFLEVRWSCSSYNVSCISSSSIP